MKKICTECSEGFVGRADKRFCSDTCRNAYNNKRNAEMNNYMRNVNNILRRNRRILEEFVPYQSKADKRHLLQKGFDPSYYTNMETSPKGHACYYCYEYGFQPTENEYLLLKRKIKER